MSQLAKAVYFGTLRLPGLPRTKPPSQIQILLSASGNEVPMGGFQLKWAFEFWVWSPNVGSYWAGYYWVSHNGKHLGDTTLQCYPMSFGATVVAKVVELVYSVPCSALLCNHTATNSKCKQIHATALPQLPQKSETLRVRDDLLTEKMTPLRPLWS
jgi:hypothetical protein